MFKEMSKFQIGLIGLFAFFIVAGLGYFSFSQGNAHKSVPIVTVWGTIDQSIMGSFVQKVVTDNGNKIEIRYSQKSPDDFDTALLEALAVGKGPDVILSNQATLLKNANKIITIPYKTYPEVNFKQTFIQEGELFLNAKGVMAIPFSVDPMVMYWNRDLFTNANISLPPKYWDEFTTIAPKLTKKDGVSSITQSGVALGEYQNIDHAKDIVSLLMMQAGNPLSVQSENGYDSTLDSAFNYSLAPANAALTFYTQFANPLKDAYSWNRALPDSKLLFYSNKLGVYIGYASEYNELKKKNPYLNFDVSVIPQSRPAPNAQTVSSTFGNIYGFSILKSTKQAQAAFDAVSLMTSKNNIAIWSQYSNLPSVRRDALSSNPSDAASAVFATSALWARGWIDPDALATETIYRNMIESITSNRILISEAISQAQNQIQDLFDTANKKNK